MKYVLPVSHGTVAPSMHETLKAFFLGDRADLIHANMKEGMGPDEYIEEVRETLQVINEMGLLERSWFLSGMNLPMVIDIMMKKDTMSTFTSSMRQEKRFCRSPFRK